MSTTYKDILDAHSIEIPAHLEAEADVPLLAGLQRQGDLIVLPAALAGRVSASKPVEIPAAGIPVIRGEATSNTHLLVGVGAWAACAGPQDLGVVTVESAVWLLHPEHGAQGLACGSYLIRRQREQADEIRIVAD